MSNEQDVREKRLNAMKFKILKAEQENLKTREKTTEQMQRRTIEVTIC